MAAVLLLVCVALGLSACSSEGGRRVLLMGDSLTEEAGPFWLDFARSAGWDAQQASFGGTAPCDFLARARHLKEDFDPQAVAISFIGNALTPCMKGKDGVPITSDAFVNRYRTDVQRLIDAFGPGTAIYLIGSPQTKAPDDRVVDVYRELATQFDNVEYVDGGTLISPDRTYADTQPCLPGEECTGPVVDGVQQNVVRSADGIHLCPVGHQPGQQCPPAYASGAWRYGRTIFEAMGGHPG